MHKTVYPFQIYFYFLLHAWYRAFYLLLFVLQAPPKNKKVKETAKAKPEEKKEEPQAEKEAPAENGEAKAEEVSQVCVLMTLI